MHTSMYHVGKLSGQQLGATTVAVHTQSRSFYITDCTSGLKFLIDTGAEVSAVPHSHTLRKIHCKGPNLQAINNTTVLTYDTCSIALNLGLHCMCRWVFIIMDVSNAILGADFLKHYGLSVEMKSHFGHIIPSPLVATKTTQIGLWKDHNGLMDFPPITSPYNGNVQIMHNVTHHIGTKGPPVHTESWRLVPEQLEIAKEEFQCMF